jgi:hypothetical protein
VKGFAGSKARWLKAPLFFATFARFAFANFAVMSFLPAAIKAFNREARKELPPRALRKSCGRQATVLQSFSEYTAPDALPRAGLDEFCLDSGPRRRLFSMSFAPLRRINDLEARMDIRGQTAQNQQLTPSQSRTTISLCYIPILARFPAPLLRFNIRMPSGGFAGEIVDPGAFQAPWRWF